MGMARGFQRGSLAVAVIVLAVGLCVPGPALAAVTRYDDTAATFSGSWSTSSLPGHYNGGLRYSSTTNNTATFAFTGTGVSFIAATWYNRGIAGVSIDGGPEQMVDLYSPGVVGDTGTVGYQQSVYTATGLADGAHTLTIRVTGTHDPAASTPYLIAVDAFDVYTPSAITATAGAGGSISPAGSTVVDHGASQSYSIVPNGGFVIEDVKVDGASVGAVSDYTFTNVTAAHTIEAVFASAPVVSTFASTPWSLAVLALVGIAALATVAILNRRRANS